MKFRTVLAAAAGMGVGYVLGTRAGRESFDQLKASAQRIAHDPDVRQKVADLPHQVRENLPKAQSVVSDAIKTASDKVQSKADDASSTGTNATPTTATTAPTPSVGDDVAQSVVTEPFVEPTVVVETTVSPETPQP